MSQPVFTSKYFDIYKDRIEIKMFLNKDTIFISSIHSMRKRLGGIKVHTSGKDYILPHKNPAKVIEVISKLKNGEEVIIEEKKKVKTKKVQEATNQESNPTKEDNTVWYKTWWYMCILFFFTIVLWFITIPVYTYLAYSNKDKEDGPHYKKVLTALVVFSILIVLPVSCSQSLQEDEAMSSIEVMIQEGRLDDAADSMISTQYKYSDRYKALAKELNYAAPSYAKVLLLSLTDDQIKDLESGTLAINKSSYSTINDRLKENLNTLLPDLEEIQKEHDQLALLNKLGEIEYSVIQKDEYKNHDVYVLEVPNVINQTVLESFARSFEENLCERDCFINLYSIEDAYWTREKKSDLGSAFMDESADLVISGQISQEEVLIRNRRYLLELDEEYLEYIATNHIGRLELDFSGGPSIYYPYPIISDLDLLDERRQELENL